LQDEIAEQIMDDIENERNWQETLSKPQKKIERLAEEALENSKTGKTKKLGFDKL